MYKVLNISAWHLISSQQLIVKTRKLPSEKGGGIEPQVREPELSLAYWELKNMRKLLFLYDQTLICLPLRSREKPLINYSSASGVRGTLASGSVTLSTEIMLPTSKHCGDWMRGLFSTHHSSWYMVTIVIIKCAHSTDIYWASSIHTRWWDYSREQNKVFAFIELTY